MRTFLLMFVAFLFIVGCAATPDAPDVEKETWKGEIAGMLEGDLELFITRTEKRGEVFVTGRINFHIRKTAGGHGAGTAAGSVKGKIVDGVLDVLLSGNARLQAGYSRVTGGLKGNMSETAASGSWTVNHREGRHSGTWTAKRTDM